MPKPKRKAEDSETQTEIHSTTPKKKARKLPIMVKGGKCRVSHSSFSRRFNMGEGGVRETSRIVTPLTFNRQSVFNLAAPHSLL